MRLGTAVARVSLLEDDPLRFRRKADERGPREVRRAAVFDEVRAFVEVGADRRPQLLRLHVDQILARALRDLVVDLLLKKRQVLLSRQAEADGVRSAPADDVAGGEDAGTNGTTGGDVVTNGDERHQQSVAVSDG